MTDFNTEQMQKLLGKNNVTVVYLEANSDYWMNQERFCNDFRDAPLSNNIVIHVQFEGISLTHSLVVPAVKKIIKETGRDPTTVYTFTPNSSTTDCEWPNLFFKQYSISDEFFRSRLYWKNELADLNSDFKTWALFVGRKTTPRLLALYNMWKDESLRQNSLLSVMDDAQHSIQVFDRPELIYDSIDNWLPIENKMQRIFEHNQFRNFCFNIPFGSIDGYNVTDQYNSHLAGENRNPMTSISLINLAPQYLFELTFETMTLGFTFTPSEKTVRTIVAEKPLVVYAPRDFLKNLQKLGFRTFGELWDESYDQLEAQPRFWAIMKLVQDINNLSKSDKLALYQQSREICAYNKKYLDSLLGPLGATTCIQHRVSTWRTLNNS